MSLSAGSSIDGVVGEQQCSLRQISEKKANNRQFPARFGGRKEGLSIIQLVVYYSTLIEGS